MERLHHLHIHQAWCDDASSLACAIKNSKFDAVSGISEQETVATTQSSLQSLAYIAENANKLKGRRRALFPESLNCSSDLEVRCVFSTLAAGCTSRDSQSILTVHSPSASEIHLLHVPWWSSAELLLAYSASPSIMSHRHFTGFPFLPWISWVWKNQKFVTKTNAADLRAAGWVTVLTNETSWVGREYCSVWWTLCGQLQNNLKSPTDSSH